MKQVILKTLLLHDWKGLNISVSFADNGVTRIQGRNGIGKSSILHAWLWLLTGYTHAGGNKNADLYDHRRELTPNTPQACVQATLLVDGREYIIERRAKAKFVRKRGTDTFEKAPSDEYTLYIDNIETSVTMFEEMIKSIFNVSITLLPYVLNGDFFSILANDDMYKARRLLEDIAGDITIDDMHDTDYSMLKEQLHIYSIDGLKEQYFNKLTPLKNRMEEIPLRIEEKQKLIAQYNENDFTAIKQDIDDCKSRIKTIDNSMLCLKEGIESKVKARNEKIKERGDVDVEIERERQKHKTALEDMVRDKERELTNKKADKAQAILNYNTEKTRVDAKKDIMDAKQKKIDEAQKELSAMRAKLNAIKERVFDENSTICAYCRQALPQEDADKLRMQFEEQKKRDKDENISKGMAMKESLDVLIAEHQKAKDEYEIANAHFITMDKGDAFDKEIKALEDGIKNIKAEYTPFENTNIYKALVEKRDAIVIPTLDSETDNREMLKEKNDLMDKLEEHNRTYGLLEQVTRLEQDVNDLEKEKVTVGQNIADIEKMQALIASYEEEKARRVSERINEHMSGCYIRMWRLQKDGNRAKDCVILNEQGVPYGTTNLSDRISINIQLQRLFCEAYDILVPTFVDEAYAFDSYHTPTVWKAGQQMVMMTPSDDNFLNVTYR